MTVSNLCGGLICLHPQLQEAWKMGLLSWALMNTGTWQLSSLLLFLLVNRQLLVPFCPQNPQFSRHKQRHLLNPHYNWKHFAKPISVSEGDLSKHECRRTCATHTWDDRHGAQPCSPGSSQSHLLAKQIAWRHEGKGSRER